MTAPHADDIIEGYMARLAVALGGADPTAAAEVQGGVRSHITESRAILVDESDADLLNLLDRLGEPSVLAAEAGGSSRQPAAPPARNAAFPKSATLAIGVLLVGAVISLFVGPFSLIPDVALLIIALWIARTSGYWADHEISIAGLVPVLLMTAVVVLVALMASRRIEHWWVFVVLLGPAISLMASAAYLSWTVSRRSRRLG